MYNYCTYRRLLSEYTNTVIDYIDAVLSRDHEILLHWARNKPRDWSIDEIREIEDMFENYDENDNGNQNGIERDAIYEIKKYWLQHRSNRRDGVLYDNSAPLTTGEILGNIDGTHLLITGQLVTLLHLTHSIYHVL